MAVWDRCRFIGPPTKYKKEMCGPLFKEYLAVCVEDADNTAIPTRVGFALFLGVAKRTLVNWESKHPLFAETMEMLKTIQEEVLTQGGLKNKLNQALVVKLLSAHHGIGSDVGDGILVVQVSRGQE